MMLDHGGDPIVDYTRTNGQSGRSAIEMAARRGRGDVLREMD